MISVIMSVYNESASELQEAIESILGQTLPAGEFIIVLDNPLRLDLKSLLLKYERKQTKIKVIINPKNIGLAASLNKAAKIANGEFLARMDADDVAWDKRFSIEMEQLKKENLDVVSGNINYISEDGKIQGHKSSIPESPQIISKILPWGSTIIHPTIIMSKKVFNKVGGYRELPTAEDYDLWLRMKSSNIQIGSVNQVVLNYRLRSNSMTSNAWHTFVVSRYVRKMFKEREKYGVDSFSQEKMSLFLEKNLLQSESKKERYNKGQRRFEMAMDQVKSRHLFRGLVYLLDSALTSVGNFKTVLMYFCFRYKLALHRKEV